MILLARQRGREREFLYLRAVHSRQLAVETELLALGRSWQRTRLIFFDGVAAQVIYIIALVVMMLWGKALGLSVGRERRTHAHWKGGGTLHLQSRQLQERPESNRFFVFVRQLIQH